MADYGYTMQGYQKDHMARVVGMSLPVSFKHCVEISGRLRNMPLEKAKRMLADVISMTRPLKFTKFNHKIGHRRGMGPGRYPIKASQEVLSLLKSVEANAQSKGLNTSSLVICHMCAQQASRPMHYGRQRGVEMKRTHVEVVVKEGAVKKTQKKQQKEAKASDAKTSDTKPVESKDAPAKAKAKITTKPAVEKGAEKAIEEKATEKVAEEKAVEKKVEGAKKEEVKKESAEKKADDVKKTDTKKSQNEEQKVKE